MASGQPVIRIIIPHSLTYFCDSNRTAIVCFSKLSFEIALKKRFLFLELSDVLTENICEAVNHSLITMNFEVFFFVNIAFFCHISLNLDTEWWHRNESFLSRTGKK